ncbi:phosphopantetheine-binding protein, partial [Staphylococcus capitis]|uniref:phosphopantetheine-binding protein n=1 Tax=Staphylococcus capitis TaxID=29388 RepID=UPI0011A06012
GIKDNFFELTGHSFHATLLLNGIESQLNKRLKVRHIIKLPTLQQLTQHIIQMQNQHYQLIPKPQRPQQYQLSPLQKTIYLFSTLNPQHTLYNI